MTIRDATTFLTSAPSARCSGIFSYEVILVLNAVRYLSAVFISSKSRLMMSSGAASPSTNDVLRVLVLVSCPSGPPRSALSSLIFDSRAAILLSHTLDNKQYYHGGMFAYRSLWKPLNRRPVWRYRHSFPKRRHLCSLI